MIDHITNKDRAEWAGAALLEYVIALVALILTLKEAEEHLDKGEDLAAIGTLVGLDELVADLNAALRL